MITFAAQLAKREIIFLPFHSRILDHDDLGFRVYFIFTFYISAFAEHALYLDDGLPNVNTILYLLLLTFCKSEYYMH
jgi:hypothetical protein